MILVWKRSSRNYGKAFIRLIFWVKRWMWDILESLLRFQNILIGWKMEKKVDQENLMKIHLSKKIIFI